MDIWFSCKRRFTTCALRWDRVYIKGYRLLKTLTKNFNILCNTDTVVTAIALPVLSYRRAENISLYHKFPKYSDTQKICCNYSKIWTMWLYYKVMSPNDADRMANSVDPDQTVCPGISVQKLRTITIIFLRHIFYKIYSKTSHVMNKNNIKTVCMYKRWLYHFSSIHRSMDTMGHLQS